MLFLDDFHTTNKEPAAADNLYEHLPASPYYVLCFSWTFMAPSMRDRRLSQINLFAESHIPTPLPEVKAIAQRDLLETLWVSVCHLSART